MATSPGSSTEQPANPYPQGISVSGGGPGSNTWQTQWDPNLNLYVANTGFGIAPIYNSSQFSQLAPGLSKANTTGNGVGGLAGAAAQSVQPGPLGQNYQFVSNASGDIPGAGSTLQIGTPGGGSQSIVYRLDPSTGNYIPTSVQGNAPDNPSLFENVLDYGSMLAAAVPGVAGLAGLADVGPGAAAIGGSTAALPDVFNTAVLDPSVFAAGASGAAGAAGALPDVFNTPTLDPSVFSEGAGAAGALPDVFNTPTLDPSVFAPGASGAASPIMLASAGTPDFGLGGLTAGVADAGTGGLSILPATGIGDMSGLSPDMASTLGIDVGTSPTDYGFSWMPEQAGGAPNFDVPFDYGDTTAPEISTFTPQMPNTPELNAATQLGETGAVAGGGTGIASKVGDWLSSGKNLASLGLLGLSGVNALRTPQLPSAAGQASGTASALTPGATATIQSGGTAAPQWAQQKASIDASINQQIQQLTEQLMQAQINSGAGGADSAVTQQKISQLQSTLETQRQQLYMAAQAQNVAQAIQVMSGSNATLMQTAQIQLQQSQQAQQAAMQTAELALLLAGGGSPSFKIG